MGTWDFSDCVGNFHKRQTNLDAKHWSRESRVGSILAKATLDAKKTLVRWWLVVTISNEPMASH